MTRRWRAHRAIRKQWAIYGVLARKGSMSETGLCMELNYAFGTLYPELMVLERKGLVTSHWYESINGLYPRHRVYQAEQE